MRRRQRRLRSWLRHERMTVAMALAEMTHHTSPRGPKMARAGKEGQRQKPPSPQLELFKLFEEEPGGVRHEGFAERRPQERVQRHTTEQLADVAPMVPSLAVPESQMVDRLVAVIKLVDSRSPGHPAFLERFSVSRRRRNCWWKCLSLSPPSATGSAGRRPTGARVTRGLVASNGA